MRDMLFVASCGGALLLAASSATAQSVPGRDLLDFPVGVLGEAPALATEAGGGLYNPATILLRSNGATGARSRATVSMLSAAGWRDVEGQLASVAHLPRPTLGFVATFARVAIGNIDRTEDTPQTNLGTVVYDALVASAGGAWRPHRHVAAGAALRYRLGRADTARAGLLGADVGLVSDALLGRWDVRVGASSYLWSPSAERDDRPALLAGADARVYGRSAAAEARLGVSYGTSRRGTTEAYGYASGRYGSIDARAGLARIAGFGDRVTHARFGVGLHYARLSAGVACETGDWLGPAYQFTLTTRLP